MARIFLAPYTIRLREKSSGTHLLLSDFRNHIDLLSVFNSYLVSHRNVYTPHTTSHSLMRVSQHHTNNRSISGIVETGGYGIESELYDVRISAVSYHRTVNDAEMLPFYFQLCIPTERDEGIALLERMGVHGIRSIFLNDFNSYFNGIYSDIEIVIYPLFPPQLVQQYITDGRVITLRFISFSVPTDVVDAYDQGGHSEQAGHTELVIKAGRRNRIPILRRISEVIGGQRNAANMVELRGFEYEKVKVEIELNGNIRTIDLDDFTKLKAQYDVTPHVQIGENGHPTYDSIDVVATELARDILNSLGIGANNVR